MSDQTPTDEFAVYEWGLEWDHLDGFPDITGPYETEEDARRNAAESVFPSRLLRREVGPWVLAPGVDQ